MSGRTDLHRMIPGNEPDNPPLLPRNVSPPRSFGAYDRYVPARANTSYRDDYSHRASSWRPNERQSSYYNGTPSPNRYESPRTFDDPWTRSPYSSSSSWADRRSSDLWELDRRREPGTERSFQPSEAWKQNYNAPRGRQESYSAPSGDRYLPEYSRDPRDFNQASRSHGPDHYAPVTSSVDHYRSYSNSYDSRDLYPNSRADSYRPQYEEDTSWNAPPVSAMARNVRTRTPDDFESPPREPRSAYVHRLPLPYADREARHYSPTRPIAYSPRARRSPSPTPYRYNNSRTNFNDNGRLQPARRVVSSPARSFKRESSPAIPGLIHGVHTNTVFQQPRQPNATPPVLQKRPSPALSDDQLPSRKKLRSVSPERHSSIASSRPSSPEPILVVGQPGVVRKVEEKNHDPRPPTTNHSSPPPEDDTVVPGMTFSPSQLTLELATLQQNGAELMSIPDPTTNRVSQIDVDAKVSDENPQEPPPGVPPIKNAALHSKPETSRDPSRPVTLQHISTPAALPAEDPIEDTLVDVVNQSDEDRNLPEILRHSTSYETSSLTEALKHAVMSRYMHDAQRRNERVEPILLSNLTIAERPAEGEQYAPDVLMQDLMEGSAVEERRKKHQKLLPSLAVAVHDRRTGLADKVERLKAEYLELHQSWLEHCARLEDGGKLNSTDDAVNATGRTTRRSAATLGDAVRSDLEMEQIIASLGNDDLTDANHLSMRNAAIIPDMLSVTHGYTNYIYDDTNNFVEDAPEFYAVRTGTNDWTEDEKQTFVEQYAANPKQFGSISEFLPNKTAAQCVTFYYLHKKKHIDFRKVIQRYASTKRRKGGRKSGDKQRGNALLADIRRHDAEVEVSSQEPGANPPKRRGRPPNSRKVVQPEVTPVTTPAATPPPPENVPRSRGGRRINLRVPALIEEDDTEEEEEPKPAKKPGRKPKKPKVTPKAVSSEEPVPAPDNSETNGRRKPSQSSVHWSEDDQKVFIELVAQHGDDFKRIAASMPNKTTVQVSIFYNVNMKTLDLGKVAAAAPQRMPTPPPPPEQSNIPSPTPSLPASKSTRRLHEQDGKKVAFEYPGSGVMSPYHSLSQAPPLPHPAYTPEPRSMGYPPISDMENSGILAPVSHDGSWNTFSSFRPVMDASSPPFRNPLPTTSSHNYPPLRSSLQHEPYFPSQQPPYNYHHQLQHAPTSISRGSELHPLPPPPQGLAPRSHGESFFINDYQHSRGPPAAQASSMTIIPGLVEPRVAEYDPRYQQPVIRVQQQDSQHQPPMTSSFMTGRVLLTTKSYTGCPSGAGSFS